MARSRTVPIALVAAAVALLFAVVVLRGALLPSRQPAVEPAPSLAIDTSAVVARFAAGLRFPTVTWDDSARWRPEPFDALHAHLAASFPALHASLEREVVLGHSVLYAWIGSEPALPPVLLLAHQDVVPPGGDPEEWTHPPFGGVVAEGFVWGRGTLDDKGALFAIMEAVEGLAAEGYRPRRTVLLAFGHDEERGGEGAAAVARLLETRGVRPAFVLDEGGFVTSGVLPLAAPIAVVGVAEKGYLTVQLEARLPGGHSSRPPDASAVGVLAEAIGRLERRPFGARLQGVTRETLEHLAPEMPFARRAVLGNLWLFRPLVERQLVASPTTAALLRTTIAPTMLAAGEKENVIPSTAAAVVNFRIMPGESTGDVLAHVVRAIADDRVTVRAYGRTRSEPTPVTDSGSEEFALLRQVIREVYPDAVVAPYLVTGGTDARHFTTLTPHVFRFLPVRLDAADIERVHGIDERIAIPDYLDGIRFYRTLLVTTTR